jgi:hypothetical protein
MSQDSLMEVRLTDMDEREDTIGHSEYQNPTRNAICALQTELLKLEFWKAEPRTRFRRCHRLAIP